MSERRKVITALVASVVLHLLIFVLLALSGLSHKEVSPLEGLKLVQVAIATPTPTPSDIFPPLPVPVRHMIDSDTLNKTEKAPEKPLFESDENSQAASERISSGKMPLPSQDGKDRRDLAFNTRKFSLGSGQGSSASPPVMEFVAAPEASPTVRPRPQSTPTARPKPTPPQESTPKPAPKPTSTPTETEDQVAEPTPVPEPTAGAAPLYRPTPAPAPTASAQATPDARPTPAATPKPEVSLAMLATTPRPRTTPSERSRPEQPGYHPETQQTKIEDGISNRGKTGVDAIGTPVGRYRKKISDAIGSRWYYYVNQRMDLITTGSVRIKFYVNQSGHVEDLKIISNESNQTLANYSVQAITAARIPPPPGELAPALENGRYEVTYTFTIYPN